MGGRRGEWSAEFWLKGTSRGKVGGTRGFLKGLGGVELVRDGFGAVWGGVRRIWIGFAGMGAADENDKTE